MFVRTLVTGAALAAVALTGSVAAASSASAASYTATTPTKISACQALDQRIAHVTEAQKTLASGADVKGSIAYAAKMESATKDGVAVRWHERAEIRGKWSAALPDIKSNLEAAKLVCSAMPDLVVRTREKPTGDVCDRIADRAQRLTDLKARLGKGEDTAGSLASLKAKAAKAQAEGKTDLAKGYTARLAVRTKINETVGLVLHDVEEMRATCGDHS